MYSQVMVKSSSDRGLRRVGVVEYHTTRRKKMRQGSSYALTFARAVSRSASVVDAYPKKTGLTTEASYLLSALELPRYAVASPRLLEIKQSAGY